MVVEPHPSAMHSLRDVLGTIIILYCDMLRLNLTLRELAA